MDPNNRSDLKRRLVTTAYLFLGYVAYGLTGSLSAPALIEISALVRAPFDEVSYGLGLRFICYGVGGLLIGFTMKRTDRQLTVILCLAVSSVAVLVVPFIRTLNLYIGSEGVFGFFTGGVNCAFNAWIIELWPTNPGPFMQGLHFFYSLGMIIAPAMEAPFLAVVNDTNQTTSDVIQSTDSSDSRITIPFMIGGISMLVSALFAVVIRFKYPDTRSASRHQQIINQDKWDNMQKLVMLMSMLLFVAQQVVETTITSFLPTFTVYSDLHLSEESAAVAASVLAIAMTVFRAVGSILAAKVSNNTILSSGILLIVLSNILLLTWTHMSMTGLWFVIVIMGAGESVSNPCTYSFLSEKMEMTAFVCGCCMFAGCLGSLMSPAVVGRFLPSFSPVFPIVNLIGTTFYALVLGAFIFIDRMSERIRE